MSMKAHTVAGAMALMLFGAMVLQAAPACAQAYDPKYPVCLQVYDDFTHYYFECSYTSMPLASASGRYAQCVVNPYFAGPKARGGPRKKGPS
jgi:uncharacterized protein DUF3551